MRADPQAIFARLSGEFFHIALQVGLQRVDFLADASAQLLWDRSQLRDRFVSNLQLIPH
jgi:hypothetical protein